jgi:phosphatidate cytidylyltransferase
MKTRLLTSTILLAVVIPIIILGGIPFYVLLAAVIIVGCIELFHSFAKLDVHLENEKPEKWPLGLQIVIVFFTLAVAFSPFQTIINGGKFAIEQFSLPIELLVPYFLILLIWSTLDSDVKIKNVFYIGFITMFFALGVQGILLLRSFEYANISKQSLVLFFFNRGFFIFFYGLLICICTDTFAYLTGFSCTYLFGSERVHPLIPRVSPKKTWEGAVGGLLFGALIPFTFALIFNWLGYSWPILLALSFGLSIIAQLGDLAFSLIKRYFSIKDFSNIFPGHGGLFDRLDSILFVIITLSLLIKII